MDPKQKIEIPLEFWIIYLKEQILISFPKAKKRRNPVVNIGCKPVPSAVFTALTGCDNLKPKKTCINMLDDQLEHIFGPDWDKATFDWGGEIDSILKAKEGATQIEYDQQTQKLTLKIEVHLYNTYSVRQW